MAAHATYKLILVGDGNTGKTSWVRALRDGPFKSKYTPTLGVQVHPVRIRQLPDLLSNLFSASAIGFDFQFDCWDTAGQEKFRGMVDGYYVMGDCALVFHDLTNESSFQHVDAWIADVRRVCPDIPIVVVGTKNDLLEVDAPVPVYPDHVNLYLSIKTGTREELQGPLVALTRILRASAN